MNTFDRANVAPLRVHYPAGEDPLRDWARSTDDSFCPGFAVEYDCADDWDSQLGSSMKPLDWRNSMDPQIIARDTIGRESYAVFDRDDQYTYILEAEAIQATVRPSNTPGRVIVSMHFDSMNGPVNLSQCIHDMHAAVNDHVADQMGGPDE